MFNFLYVLFSICTTLRLVFIKTYRWFMYDEEERKLQNNSLKKILRENSEVRKKAREAAKNKVLADLCVRSVTSKWINKLESSANNC